MPSWVVYSPLLVSLFIPGCQQVAFGIGHLLQAHRLVKGQYVVIAFDGADGTVYPANVGPLAHFNVDRVARDGAVADIDANAHRRGTEADAAVIGDAAISAQTEMTVTGNGNSITSVTCTGNAVEYGFGRVYPDTGMIVTACHKTVVQIKEAVSEHADTPLGVVFDRQVEGNDAGSPGYPQGRRSPGCR